MTDQSTPRRYLTLSEVAAQCGVTRVALYKRSDLLPADVQVGTQRGWDPERVAQWWQSVNHVRGGAAPRRRS